MAVDLESVSASPAERMDRTLPVQDFEAEIEELRRLNEELKNDLVESATVGQNILSRNNELEDQLREHRDCYTRKQEASSTGLGEPMG